MTQWKTGPYENEEAQETLREVRDGDLMLEAMLPMPGQRVIEADQGQIIIALSHLAGSKDEDLPEGITPDMVAELRTPQSLELLRQGLEATLSDSTVSRLCAEWMKEGEEQYHEWKAASHIALK